MTPQELRLKSLELAVDWIKSMNKQGADPIETAERMFGYIYGQPREMQIIPDIGLNFANINHKAGDIIPVDNLKCEINVTPEVSKEKSTYDDLTQIQRETLSMLQALQDNGGDGTVKGLAEAMKAPQSKIYHVMQCLLGKGRVTREYGKDCYNYSVVDGK